MKARMLIAALAILALCAVPAMATELASDTVNVTLNIAQWAELVEVPTEFVIDADEGPGTYSATGDVKARANTDCTVSVEVSDLVGPDDSEIAATVTLDGEPEQSLPAGQQEKTWGAMVSVAVVIGDAPGTYEGTVTITVTKD